jgi:hypothetical protein
MQIMNKSVLILACLAFPLAAWAADAKPTAKPNGKSAKPAATAPAPAASPINSRAAVHASKARGSDMGACRKQAEDKGLRDVEAKQFMVTCMRSK